MRGARLLIYRLWCQIKMWSVKSYAERFYIFLLAASLLFYIVFRPIYKYGEYVYSLPRINATAISIMLLFFVAVAYAANFLRKKLLEAHWFEILSGLLLLWVVFLHIVHFPYLASKI